MRRRGPGLAAERTALAWVRTLTGLVGVSLLVFRAVLLHWPPPAAVLTIVVVGIHVVVACFFGDRRRRALRKPRPGAPNPALPVAVMAGSLITAALGGAILLR
ncbi:DUF202 domain-containing protein [Cryptosporangium phraense]|uniref:DUF202 domain-containing protein n=1 Tax=Cryptosporangium phraense TaxID=2593070 RepID=A0A545APQ3_9ACTN|nr:DUF202 domain-containing protein [Cryptosporangium phraense]TQS43241.1 DUF202 domain-containing protein [Cryptosporangium phraense]